MKSIGATCLKHNKLNELYCNTCKVYLCPECITEHDLDLNDHNYMHITQYASKHALKKLDQLIEIAPDQEKKGSEVLNELNMGLKYLAPRILEVNKQHQSRISFINQITSQFPIYAKSKKEKNLMENLGKQFNQDKEILTKCISNNNIGTALRIVQKVDEEEVLISKKIKAASLLDRLKESIKKLSDLDSINKALEISKKLIAKYDSYKILPYVKEWCCDKTHLPRNMTLSEDGLQIGISNSNEYSGIVGDHVFDHGLYAFEVIPEGLDCKGKEGFGIIEEKHYMTAIKNNAEIPLVYDKMIGFLYEDEIKGMKSIKFSNMKMGSKYFVRVDMIKLKMMITGPNLSLWTDLKLGTHYFPCFSCGCTNNKMTIRPLTCYGECELLDVD